MSDTIGNQFVSSKGLSSPKRLQLLNCAEIYASLLWQWGIGMYPNSCMQDSHIAIYGATRLPAAIETRDLFGRGSRDTSNT